MSDEETRDWLIEYTATVLVVISRRTPAAIRHSTKSNIKYIYGSAVEFVCGGLDNRFRARCSRECPIYAEMEAKRLIQAEEARNPKPYVPPVLPVIVPVKVANREQFAAARQLVREEIEKGTKKQRIVEILQERGFKTRTGRPWTRGILEQELAKLRAGDAIAAREKSMTRAAPAPPQAEAGPIEGPRDTGG